jgi:hypothetical protein
VSLAVGVRLRNSSNVDRRTVTIAGAAINDRPESIAAANANAACPSGVSTTPSRVNSARVDA